MAKSSGIQISENPFGKLFGGANKVNVGVKRDGSKFNYRSGDRAQRNAIEHKFNDGKKTYDAVATCLFIQLANPDGTAYFKGSKPHDDSSDDPSPDWSFKKFCDSLDYDEAIEMAAIIRKRNSDLATEEDKYSLDDKTREQLGNSTKSQAAD